MGSRRKTGDSARLPGISRRVVIGAASAAPVLSIPHTTAPEPAVGRCAEWLAIDFEIDRLSLRWSALETRMAREFGWFELPLAQRLTLPEAAEMLEIEQRLERLSDDCEQRLETLSKLEAKTLHGVAGKLTVAARVLMHEGGPAHRIVAGAVRDLAARRCPDCGATYVANFKRM